MSRAKVIAMIDAFVERYPEQAYGFGHIVLDDYNLDDSHIQHCLREKWIAETTIQRLKDSPDIASEILNNALAAIDFLESLLEIPEDVRNS